MVAVGVRLSAWPFLGKHEGVTWTKDVIVAHSPSGLPALTLLACCEKCILIINVTSDVPFSPFL